MKEILYVQAFMQLHDKFEQPGSKWCKKGSASGMQEEQDTERKS